VHDSSQVDERINDLRKEQTRDKEKIRQQNDIINQLTKDLENANSFKENLKDKDPTRQIADLIQTNEELTRKLVKYNKEIGSLKENLGEYTKLNSDLKTELEELRLKNNLPSDWLSDYKNTRNKERSELE